MATVAEYQKRGEGRFPGFVGLVVAEIGIGRARLELPIAPHHIAPNSYLHAGAIVTLADTAAGYGCFASLPDGATGFTTIELKSNFLGTARDGVLECVATSAHRGVSTQVWDAVVRLKDTDKVIALFRCTQMILYPRS